MAIQFTDLRPKCVLNQVLLIGWNCMTRIHLHIMLSNMELYDKDKTKKMMPSSMELYDRDTSTQDAVQNGTV